MEREDWERKRKRERTRKRKRKKKKRKMRRRGRTDEVADALGAHLLGEEGVEGVRLVLAKAIEEGQDEHADINLEEEL